MIQSENFINKKKLILFDLDGVLIDSRPNMMLAWNFVNKKFNLGKSFKEYFKFIGIPFPDILQKLGVHKNQLAIEDYFISKSSSQINLIKMFPYVNQTLSKLKKKGKIVGILTSKDIRRTKKILKKIQIKPGVLKCPEPNIPGKPNPFQILKILEDSNISSDEAVYVGDMYVDFMTANNANVDFVFVEYGYGKNKNYTYKIKNISNIFNL